VVLQPDSCITTLRSRVDQDVDLDSELSFDGTALEEYPYLGMEFDLPSKSIILTAKATSDDTYTTDISGSTDWTLATGATGTQLGAFTPIIPNVILDEITDFSPETASYFQSPMTFPGSPPPELFYLNDTTGILTSGTYTYSIRLKGTWNDSSNATRTVSVTAALRKGSVADGTGSTAVDQFTIDNYTTGIPRSTDFDSTMSGTMALADGDYVWLYVFVNYLKTTTGATTVSCDIDSESSIDVTVNSTAAVTPCKLYLVNEVLSRTVEAVTDGCMKVRSNYFGRTDSSPYSTDTDGCGALEALTNGLMIRQARMQDGTRPKFTASFQSLYNGLKAIHAIGVGIDTDPITGEEVITVEPIQDYYSDDIILTVDNNNVVKTIDEAAHIGKINIGYAKWEAEEFNGLDEFLTKREYRTTLKNAGGELNQLSSFIASGYAIEITRRKDITTEDWRFDEDTFIICLRRQDTYGQLMEVEQGNIDNASNILDPDTIYNYRISPIRNLLRWLWYIMASYRQPANESLKFTSGTANVIASGILDDITCRVESEIIAENANVDLDSLDTYTPPIWFNERVSFTCPLTYSEYLLINETPNGLIGYICNETTAYGWISRMEYDLQAGEASFTLIPKRDA